MNENSIVRKKKKLTPEKELFIERIKYIERTRASIAWFVIISFVILLSFPLLIFTLSILQLTNIHFTLNQVYEFWKNIAAIFGPIVGMVIAYYFKSLE